MGSNLFFRYEAVQLSKKNIINNFPRIPIVGKIVGQCVLEKQGEYPKNDKIQTMKNNETQ
jgi:hypothetical protein